MKKKTEAQKRLGGENRNIKIFRGQFRNNKSIEGSFAILKKFKKKQQNKSKGGGGAAPLKGKRREREE